MLLSQDAQPKNLVHLRVVEPCYNSVCCLGLTRQLRSVNTDLVSVPDFFEDGLPPPAQAYLQVCSAVSEASLDDVKPSSPPAILASPPKEEAPPLSGTTVQRRSVLHTEEIVSLTLSL